MIVTGGVLGAVIELAVVRRLFNAPRVILFVATLGVAQLVLVAQLYLPQLESFGGYPTAWDENWEVAGILVRSEHLLVLIVVPILTGLLAWFLGATKYGTAIRASAANSDAARLNAIRVKAMSTTCGSSPGCWPPSPSCSSPRCAAPRPPTPSPSGPALLLRALAAGLLGRMRNMPVALLAGTGIGITEALLFFNNTTEPGRIDALLFLIVLGAVLLAARQGGDEESGATWSFSPRVRPIPAALEQSVIVRRLPQIGTALALLAAVLLPVLVNTASRQFLYSRMLLFAAVAVSLTILTGWAGQLSLGQFAFVGLGAVSTYRPGPERRVLRGGGAGQRRHRARGRSHRGRARLAREGLVPRGDDTRLRGHGRELPVEPEPVHRR